MLACTYSLGHEAEGLLTDYVEDGFPVDYGDDWIEEQINVAL